MLGITLPVTSFEVAAVNLKEVICSRIDITSSSLGKSFARHGEACSRLWLLL